MAKNKNNQVKNSDSSGNSRKAQYNDTSNCNKHGDKAENHMSDPQASDRERNETNCR